ncbi:MAG: 4-hydroxy-3-methylbut-2-enyl diphosphate reductase [Spirochaetia bacterium]|nr:4-hydroxy-3-methylbut-2-enyl diphosphate reductase [Spirochaetia bacterium]
MNVIKSEVIGYCKGVSRAISIVEEAIKLGEKLHLKVYTLGYVIHNPQVVGLLKEKGVTVIEEAQASTIEPGIVVLRAHGVSDEVRRLFLSNNFYIFDATCPIVLKEQTIVEKAPKDSTIVVIGGQNHPEAIALRNVETPNEKVIISDICDIKKIPINHNLFVVIQSTYPSGMSKEIVNGLESYASENKIEIEFANELCNSNQRRRTAVGKLSKLCNCIIVIGGKNSSNTTGIYNYCKNQGVETYLVSNKEEIPLHVFDYETIGLATGTSTPPFVIDEIEEYLKRGKNET